YIYSDSTLNLVSGNPGSIYFNGSNATLELGCPATFNGQIQNIGIGDKIDLAGVTVDSASYNGSTLTIHENGQTLTYFVTGNVAGDVLTLASDNNGGTDIYWVPPQESWISGLAGDWSAASDWVSGVVPTSADDAVINNSSAVTVNGAAVAHSLGLNNSDLTI